MDCELAEDAKRVSTSFEPMNSVYTALPKRGHPGMVLNKYGKGTSLFIAGTFGVCYADRAHADYAQIIKNMISQFTEPVVEIESVGLVEAVLRHQKGRLLLHLINLTGEMTRPFNSIVPLSSIKLKVHTGNTRKCGPNASLPYTVRGEQLKDVEYADCTVSMTLSGLKDYEVIVIPLEA
jgi:hypothetical protein